MLACSRRPMVLRHSPAGFRFLRGLTFFLRNCGRGVFIKENLVENCKNNTNSCHTQEHRPTGHDVRCSVSGVARVSAPLLRIPGTAVLLLSPPTTLMWSSLLLPRRRGTITGNQCSVKREQCGRSCASFGDRAAGGCAQRRSCGACIGERGERCGGSCA